MTRTVSIIISSHNYAAFLRHAIDSALAQSHAGTEVIVVDDGSADASRQIIESYGQRVGAILKANGGQASALNAGFERSTGQIVIFLDSDDVLEPGAAACAASAIDHSTSKVHWPMRKISAEGCHLDQLIPEREMPRGDLRQVVLDHGPRSDGYLWPLTSGNAWSRSFLSQVMPIPPESYRTCPDLYLCALAPLYGEVHALPEPLSLWRDHGENNTGKDLFRCRVARYVTLWEACCADLERHARKLGLASCPARWLQESWWHRLRATTDQLSSLLPPAKPFVLIDDETWACDALDARPARPLLSHGGPPVDDEQAIAALGTRRAEGAGHLVVAQPAMWWLHHYRQFAGYLERHFRKAARTDEFALWDLSPLKGVHG